MIKVLVADDHAVVRRGLRQIVEETTDIIIFGEASDGMEVLKKVRSGKYDVVVLDISMPGKSGLDVLSHIRIEYPNIPVLILSIHSEEQYAVRLLKAGASGYLSKEHAPSELVKAIRQVSQGKKYITPVVAEKLAYNLQGDFPNQPHESLSDREFEVLCLIASGKTAKQIAEELCLSVKTVATYRSRIFKKMRMETSKQLIHYAVKNKLVD